METFTGEIGVCACCGKEFPKRSYNHLYCSKECKHKAKLLVDKQYKARLKEMDEESLVAVRSGLQNKNVPNESIEEIAVLAFNKGVSYGTYVARYLK